MRSSTPTLHCDGADGECPTNAWTVDYYETTVSSVGSVKITSTERAPGWVSTPWGDFCPTCKEGP